MPLHWLYLILAFAGVAFLWLPAIYDWAQRETGATGHIQAGIAFVVRQVPELRIGSLSLANGLSQRARCLPVPARAGLLHLRVHEACD